MRDSAKRPPRLSVVIPVWAGAQPQPARPSLRGTLEALVADAEIVVSVGLGQARVEEEVARLGAQVIVAEGAGYGEILREGIRVASGDYVITMDADLSHRPSVVRALWSHRDQGDVVIASR